MKYYLIIAMASLLLVSCASLKEREGKITELNTANYIEENLAGALDDAHVTFSKDFTLISLSEENITSKVLDGGEILITRKSDGENDVHVVCTDTAWVEGKEGKKFHKEKGKPVMLDTEMKILNTKTSTGGFRYVDIAVGNVVEKLPFRQKDGVWSMVLLKKSSPEIKFLPDSVKHFSDQNNRVYSIRDGVRTFIAVDQKGNTKFIPEDIAMQSYGGPDEIETSLLTLSNDGEKGEIKPYWTMKDDRWQLKVADEYTRVKTPHGTKDGFASFIYDGVEYYIMVDSAGNEWGIAATEADVQLKSVRIKQESEAKGIDGSLSY